MIANEERKGELSRSGQAERYVPLGYMVIPESGTVKSFKTVPKFLPLSVRQWTADDRGKVFLRKALNRS